MSSVKEEMKSALMYLTSCTTMDSVAQNPKVAPNRLPKKKMSSAKDVKKTALAYFAIYSKKNSVGQNPLTDYQIGVEKGVVGCGTKFTDKKMGLEWFTMIEDHLIYNGPILERIDENPWAASGRNWYTYKVNHHFDLGPIGDALQEAGVSFEILPRSQNRYCTDESVHNLINYARMRLAKANEDLVIKRMKIQKSKK